MADDIDDLLMEADEYLGVVNSSEKGKIDQKYAGDSRITPGSHTFKTLDSSNTKFKSSNQNTRRYV